METAQIVELLLSLLIAASLIAMITRRLRLPYTIALVFGGILIDVFRVPLTELMGEKGSTPWLTSDIIFMVFLPGLLFEAGINIRFQRLVSNLVPIGLLAVIGIASATVITGFAVHQMSDLPLTAALVFGALISATDPISVLALFKQLGVSKRLAVLVEGESLFNDGSAVVLFSLLLEAMRAGDTGILSGVGQFFYVAVGGAAIGAGLGYLVSRVTQQIDDPQVEITLTTILAYGSYLLAEHFHVSGVIATVLAGLMVGNFGAEVGMSSRTRVAVWTFWEYIGFVINSLVFLLIGIEVHVLDLLDYWREILLALAAVFVGRALVVYPLAALGSRLAKPIPWRWRHVMFWGGIRGGVSIALALSLPFDFPGRELVLAMTFGVVAFSIVGQGLTIGPLLRWLGVQMGEEDDYDRARVRQMAASRAIEELEAMRSVHGVSELVYNKLRAELDARLDEAGERIRTLHEADPAWGEEEERIARARLLTAEKTTIQKAVNEGLISQHTAEDLTAERDARLDQVVGPSGR